jgi:transposase
MATRPPITSPYAPDLEAVGTWLRKMIAELRFVEIVVAILSLLGRMRDANTELLTKLTHLKRRRPPSETRERLERQLALPLVDAAAAAALTGEAQPEGDANAAGIRKKKRRANHHGRAALPAHLERVVVLNNVSAEERICPTCGAEMKTVSHSSCEILDVRPAEIIVTHRRDETVACPNDDTIVSAPTPPQIVERGKLADTLLVEALCDKYLEHQPVERQCTKFLRSGVDIAPQTLGRGVVATIDLLTPVAKLIVERTRGPGLLANDATGIPILDPCAPMGVRSGTMWCWTNACWVSFFYSASGDSKSVRRFLGDDLARTVQCDGTNVMSFLERAGGKRPGCWAHGRRGLVEAAKLGDKIAPVGVRIIARLFAVEKASTLAGDTAAERRARREEHAPPVLAELREWLDGHRANTPPKTPLGRALGYLHRQWPRLILFLDDGNIELTNNRRERELRRRGLGTRNWLFAWLDVGGERTAAILTILATCIAHDVNPRRYLHLVARLIVHGWPNARLRDLLPDRILLAHPELYVGEPSELPTSPDAPALGT